jgi:spermidine synthase
VSTEGADGAVVVARARDAAGEIVLRRRGDLVELIVDGVFAMDSAHTETEEALAALALQRLSGNGLHIVVGGLGLGFTTRRLLAEPRVRRIDVVELHAPLVRWVGEGLVPAVRGLLDDPRVVVRLGDVRDVVPALAPRSVDAVLLDVDNGPGFLVHPANATVYGPAFVTAAARTLRPRGVLGVWSADPSPDLAVTVERACGACD